MVSVIVVVLLIIGIAWTIGGILCALDEDEDGWSR